MKKYYYVCGNRDGGLWEMSPGSKERGREVVHLSASKAEKKELYDIYAFIESKIIHTLKSLTSTRKTKIILLPDDFLQQLSDYTHLVSRCAKVCWIFFPSQKTSLQYYLTNDLDDSEECFEIKSVKWQNNYLVNIQYCLKGAPKPTANLGIINYTDLIIFKKDICGYVDEYFSRKLLNTYHITEQLEDLISQLAKLSSVDNRTSAEELIKEVL